MENSNDNINNKKRNKSLIVIVILSIVVLALGGYICYDKFINTNNDYVETKNNEEYNDNNKDPEENENNNDIVEDTSTNIDYDLDFNELSNTLHSAIKKDNITTFISKCESKSTNKNEPPETKQNNIEVSSNSIDIIINKLKTAKTIDKNITYSWFGCPPKSITYYVSIISTNSQTVRNQRVFSLNYSNEKNILLVGYNNIGYAFHFNSNEEINNFIESLK